MTQKRIHSTFYLHGGPGASAIPEREWLGESLEVYWWDQPRPKSSALRPFAELVDAAEAEFCRLAAEAGGKMGLLANSFGAHLALHLAHRVPQHISSMVLLSPVCDMETAFIRLARRLAEGSSQREQLSAAAEALEKRPGDREKFWQLVGTIFSCPGFLDAYWSPNAEWQRQWLGELMASNPAVFDFDAFQAITNDFLDGSAVDVKSQFDGPVSAVLGTHDPLIDTQVDGKIWQRCFPQAKVKIIESGHFVHMELPPERWLAA